MCLGRRRGQRRSVRDLGHLLLQLGNAFVLVGDRVFYGFQLFQDLIQFGFVLLEGERRRVRVRRADGSSRRTRGGVGASAGRTPGAGTAALVDLLIFKVSSNLNDSVIMTLRARSSTASGSRASSKDTLDRCLLFNGL